MIKNLPAALCLRKLKQGLCINLEGWDVGVMGGRFKREGICVYLWLIHVEVWQKTTQFCKAIILQLKNKLKRIKKRESTCHAGDPGSIPGLVRSTGVGIGYPLQDSGLENSMDCKVLGVAKSQALLSDFHSVFTQQTFLLFHPSSLYKAWDQ